MKNAGRITGYVTVAFYSRQFISKCTTRYERDETGFIRNENDEDEAVADA